jgi:hypothetical protein
MAFTAGRLGAILVAQYDLSAFLKSWDTTRDIGMLDTTVFGLSSRTYIPGIIDANVTLAGLYDATASTGSDAILNAAFGAAAQKPITILPEGSGTQGNRAIIVSADESSYKASAAVDGLVEISAEFKPSGGMWGGHLASILSAKTTATNTSGVDGAASTTSGWVANLHVTSFTGTSIAIKIADSADNSTFADLTGGAFASVTGVTSEQLNGAAGATVRRYTRIAWSGTFTSVTFAVAFSRKA